jgi:hypothetical protein
MHTAAGNVAVFGYLLFIVTSASNTGATPLSAGVSPNSVVTPRARSAEEDKREFKRLVEYLGVAKCVERSITTFQESAKCPFRALTFDGVTQVICDFSHCRGRPCPRDCRQAYAYLNLSTLDVTTEEPLVDYRKVYMGCIFEERSGIESARLPKLV